MGSNPTTPIGVGSSNIAAISSRRSYANDLVSRARVEHWSHKPAVRGSIPLLPPPALFVGL